MSNSYVMKISSNGQVSIPAKARARWGTRKVLVVDLVDRVVMRPLPDDPLSALRGKYAAYLPNAVQIRRQTQIEDEEREQLR